MTADTIAKRGLLEDPLPPEGMEFHPYGARTRPHDDEWALDDDTCLITQAALDRLDEYSSTIPTGKYAGKVWKAWSRPKRPAQGGWWMLGEYCVDPVEPEKYMLIRWRKIEVVS